MELSVRELNELIFCIDIARKYGHLIGTSVADKLELKLLIELGKGMKIDLITPMLEEDK